jgi:ketosteroid isomerase-like protein
MKTKYACVLPLAVLIALLPLRSPTAPPSPEQEVRELERQVNAAYAANDLPRYFSFYAPDFTQYLPEGRTDLEAYRREWTGFIQSGGRVESVDLRDVHVQIGPSADTAVASYILHVQTKSPKGNVTAEDNQESDVLFKRNGEWKIVFLHYSAAPKKGE